MRIFQRYTGQHRRYGQGGVSRTCSRPFTRTASALAGCDCGKSVTNYDFNLDVTKEKNMTLSQIYRTALIAIAGFLLTAVLHTGAAAQATPPQGVRNIVIVHGAWADGSSWSKVIPLLQAKGLHVVAV